MLGTIASKAITMGRFDEAERILIPHLDALLERAVRRNEYHSGKYLRAYQQVIQKGARSEYSPSERFLLGRLDGLTQVILAR